MDNVNNIDFWYSENELRDFIRGATTRHSIESIKKSISDFYPYSSFFDYTITNARENYELFINQLRDKLSKSQNWKAIEIDVIERFIPMIENYKEWFKLNQNEINTIKDNNPYEIMLDVIKMTEKAIYKYFSGIDVFEHYKITGRTPFSIPSLLLFSFTTLTRDNFEEFKLRYDIKLSNFKELVSKIESTNERNVIINDTYDKFIKLSERTNITNYKEYFIQLANIVKSQQVIKEDKPGKQNEKSIKDLFSCFESPTKYKKVMDILADRQLIHPNTYIWKDKKTGHKTLLCALLKDIEGKQYFKPEIKLNWVLCKILVENPFRLPVSSNKTFYDATLQPDFKNLIPYASTLEENT